MYRDGVGEGHFDEIVTFEVRAIKKACNTLDSTYNPKLTFIIVQKRNHVRLFPVDNLDCDKNGNMLSGTVIDSGICSPHDFDFFMCSHAGLKGTSKPSHYHVLWDDMNLTADQLEEFTFYMCHLYARCTRAVSIPAPAYYAHLAAYRARFYSAFDEDDENDNTSAHRTNLAQVAQQLKSCLYYC